MSDQPELRRPGIEQPGIEQADYRFSFEPLNRRVRAELDGTTVVDSERVMVMKETRLPPVYYFPWDDVRADRMTRTKRNTHCPFKGNASYWTLTVGDRVVTDAVWSYEEPFADAKQISGYVAFYQDLLDAWYEDDIEVAAELPTESNYSNPLMDWMIREAPSIEDSKSLTRLLAETMVEAGIPIVRLHLIIRTLHPQVMATAYRWWRAKEEIEERLVPYSTLDQPEFLNSPLASIFEGAGGIRRRLDGDDPALDFPILKDLHDEGATDYVAMPLTFSDGLINAITLTSDRRGGFNTADLGHIYEILGLLARLYEVHAMRRTAVTLLDTYLGQHAGAQVLNGRIKRGDKENINAVIWFCDLRESTELAQRLSKDDFLGALNQYFDCMAGAVLDHGGQVLRFIGDAALAIFPLQGMDVNADDPISMATLNSAISAVREAQDRMNRLNLKRAGKNWEQLRYGIALHVGEVTYGNIGTENRLEFTVVGDAANRAARIESMCKTLNEPVLLSSEIAKFFPGITEPLGVHELRGVRDPVTVYALRPPGVSV